MEGKVQPCVDDDSPTSVTCGLSGEIMCNDEVREGIAAADVVVSPLPMPSTTDCQATSPSPQAATTAVILPPLNVHVPETTVAPAVSRRSIQQLFQQPRHLVRGLGLQQAAALHKKTLKPSIVGTAPSQFHLKLGTLKSKDISALVLLIHVVVLFGPMLQVIWTVLVEPDEPPPKETDRSFEVTKGDIGEAIIQVVVVVTSCVFTRRILTYPNRQPVQVALATLNAFAGIISAITLAADVLKSYRPNAKQGHLLLSFANGLLVSFIFITLAFLTDHYAEIILSAEEGLVTAKVIRLREKSRQFSLAFNITCGIHLIIRLAVIWRSSVVLDFIPMANIITPIRVHAVEHKQFIEPHVFVDALLVSIADAVLFAVTYSKCYFTHHLFKHIFMRDFARIYTEYSIFVVNFRHAITIITISGHLAAWTVPFYHTIHASELSQPRIPIVNIGSVQMQLGFRISLMLWLVVAMYCALPANSKGLRGWFVATAKQKVSDDSVKYFLYESDVHFKIAYRNLAHVGHVDGDRFILENQVEAFNFAQLVYARGNKNYDQGLDGLHKLVGDPSFEVVLDVVHDIATDTHCLVLASETKIVVTFRGTSSKKNAKTDLQSSMTLHISAKQLDLTKVASVRPHANAVVEAEKAVRTIWHRLKCKRNDPKVHFGFYAAYLSVADRVLATVRNLHGKDDRPILVTGHSLGGALAALCSFDIVARLKISNVTCTTFGCPRIGNNAFRKRYSHVVPATFAFVNASDMITKLPPHTPKAQSYTSVGKTVLINAFGNLVIEPNVLEMGMLHRGYSPKAHTMRAYHLAMLLWCLRFHQNKYHPKFWRQSLAFLQAEYGHLPEVREYLKASTAIHINSTPAASLGDKNPVSLDGGEIGPLIPQNNLRLVVRRLEAALREERESQDERMLPQTVLSQIWWWLCQRELNEVFTTDDAIRVLRSTMQLESEEAAVDLGQLLTVHGFIKPDRAVFTRHSHFIFPALDDDDGEEDDEVEQQEKNP